MAEHPSPKRKILGSSPSSPAKCPVLEMGEYTAFSRMAEKDYNRMDIRLRVKGRMFTASLMRKNRMAMTPRTWSDLGLARRYSKSDADMNRLLGSIRRFVKWVEDTHGEVINAILEHDGEKWTVTIYVQQE